MAHAISRRRALAGLSAAAALPLVGCATPARYGQTGPFRPGVASGDPDPHSVVLWTRVSGIANKVSGQWELASDAGFETLVASGRFDTDAGRDHTVKVLAEQLPAGERF